MINLFPLFISFFYEYFEKQSENGKMQISNFNASSRPDEGRILCKNKYTQSYQ